ncbi:type II secretion system F family protein [Litoreibacter janthinus]|uniref:Tight adherence protein B n=1 Tax=Litoreibacter janthinus TaxID=670154 RepID=A0A1I6GCF9_9RHOB|nr:type II secretion system F family protein [Litoreibacter janthinus]SFR39820.1 tight adherence protein B [Litoreibacter janthinus]
MSDILLLFAASFAVFAGLALFLLIRADRTRRAHRARLLRVRSDVLETPLKPTKRIKTGDESQSLTARIERQLVQTSLRVSIPELLAQLSLAMLGLYAVAVLVLDLHPLIALPASIVLPVLAALLILRIAKNRYRTAFTSELPEALDVFARGLRAGRPVSDSLAIVVENAKGPIQTEFTRCRDEMRMGTTLPDTLGRLEARIPTPEVSFFAVATSLQAETGGNLIETMEGLANQLRERRKLRKKARALSSEARASAVILASLPFAVAFLLAALNGAYLEPLYTDPRGQVMSVVAVTSIAAGVFLMAQMGKLDV